MTTALVLVDCVNISLILFDNSWKFESSAIWLIPEILLLLVFSAISYWFYFTKRIVFNSSCAGSFERIDNKGLQTPSKDAGVNEATRLRS